MIPFRLGPPTACSCLSCDGLVRLAILLARLRRLGLRRDKLVSVLSVWSHAPERAFVMDEIGRDARASGRSMGEVRAEQCLPRAYAPGLAADPPRSCQGEGWTSLVAAVGVLAGAAGARRMRRYRVGLARRMIADVSSVTTDRLS